MTVTEFTAVAARLVHGGAKNGEGLDGGVKVELEVRNKLLDVGPTRIQAGDKRPVNTLFDENDITMGK